MHVGPKSLHSNSVSFWWTSGHAETPYTIFQCTVLHDSAYMCKKYIFTKTFQNCIVLKFWKNNYLRPPFTLNIPLRISSSMHFNLTAHWYCPEWTYNLLWGKKYCTKQSEPWHAETWLFSSKQTNFPQNFSNIFWLSDISSPKLNIKCYNLSSIGN